MKKLLEEVKSFSCCDDCLEKVKRLGIRAGYKVLAEDVNFVGIQVEPQEYILVLLEGVEYKTLLISKKWLKTLINPLREQGEGCTITFKTCKDFLHYSVPVIFDPLAKTSASKVVCRESFSLGFKPLFSGLSEDFKDNSWECRCE